MRFLIYLSVLLFISTSCTKSEDNISLNGTWQFLASNELSEENILSDTAISWDTITVPGNWDTREKYSEYVGKGYYKRIFNIPANWKNDRVHVKFDAVYESSKVWLNGELLGDHVGGFTPFEFDITEKAKFNKKNTLVVLADNSYKRGAWWAWGGISRDVTLTRNNHIRIIYQHISAIPDFKKKVVNFTITVKLENKVDSNKLLGVNSIISNSSGVICNKKQNITLDANTFGISEITFSEPLEKYNLWHFNHPNLYELHTELILDGHSIDLKNDKFGIRKLEAIGEQLYLNNEVVYMDGFNRVHDHPDFGNTEPNELVLQDMLDIKSLGGVFSRVMHAPLSKNLLEICDSIGYLVIEEIPVWGDDDPQTYPDNPLTKQWLKEMIERDFNHPCVVGWSVGNELRNSANDWENMHLSQDQFEYINTMLDYIDELDTTRLKTYVSLTSYKNNANYLNEPYEKVDLLCINSYGNALNAAQKTHEKFPGKPIFLSEIGISQIGPAPSGELSDKLIEQLIGLKELPYVVGSAIWCYNDYRSNYKGTPDSGFREWGVVNEKREPKKAHKQIQRIYRRNEVKKNK